MERRPGPKPKRLYARFARRTSSDADERPSGHLLRPLIDSLERAGRLVAHGRLTDPDGDLLLLRARDREEAERALRNDPFNARAGWDRSVVEWDPSTFGSGVNLDPPPARGAGRLTGLARITVVVRDQAKALHWYREVLGFTVRSEDPETGYAELSLGRGAAGLSLVMPRAEWGEPEYSAAVARIGRATGVTFKTDSVEALRLRLAHHGVAITEPPRTQPWGERTLRFADPDGNEFLAFEIPGRTPGA